MAVLKSLSAKQNLKNIIVDVPEIGEDAQILLREFTARAASEFNKYIMDSKKDLSTTPQLQALRFYAALICATAVDEKGNLLSSLSDVDSLLDSWDEKLILKVGEKAADINGFNASQKDEVKKPSPRNRQKQ